MYVCVLYVCMHHLLYVCLYVCMYVCIYVYMCVRTVCTYVSSSVLCIYVHMYVCYVMYVYYRITHKQYVDISSQLQAVGQHLSKL